MRASLFRLINEPAEHRGPLYRTRGEPRRARRTGMSKAACPTRSTAGSRCWRRLARADQRPARARAASRRSAPRSTLTERFIDDMDAEHPPAGDRRPAIGKQVRQHGRRAGRPGRRVAARAVAGEEDWDAVTVRRACIANGAARTAAAVPARTALQRFGERLERAERCDAGRGQIG